MDGEVNKTQVSVAIIRQVVLEVRRSSPGVYTTTVDGGASCWVASHVAAPSTTIITLDRTTHTHTPSRRNKVICGTSPAGDTLLYTTRKRPNTGELDHSTGKSEQEARAKQQKQPKPATGWDSQWQQQHGLSPTAGAQSQLYWRR